MSSDKPASGMAPAFPNYFELFQNIASPFMASNANNPASNVAAMMMATLDSKEIERKSRELETVLMWLKAQVGVVEMSIKTLEYHKDFLTKMAANPMPMPMPASVASPDVPTADAEVKLSEQMQEKIQRPDLARLAKTAAAMNPALWAWNLLQQPAGGEGEKSAGGKTAPGTRTAAKKDVDGNARSRSTLKKTSTAKRTRS
jgi:hypothetical protein